MTDKDYIWLQFGDYTKSVKVYLFTADGDLVEKRVFFLSSDLLRYKSKFHSLKEIV